MRTSARGRTSPSTGRTRPFAWHLPIAYRSRPRQLEQHRAALRRGGIESCVGEKKTTFGSGLVEAHGAPRLPHDPRPQVCVVRARDERDPDRDHRREDKPPRNNAYCAQRDERRRAEPKETRQRGGRWTPRVAHDAGASGRVLRHVRPRVQTAWMYAPSPKPAKQMPKLTRNTAAKLNISFRRSPSSSHAGLCRRRRRTTGARVCTSPSRLVAGDSN
jgi:hypothetical protein